MHKDYCMKCLRDKLNWSFFLVLQTATNLQLVFRNISCEHPEMWSWSASNLIFPCCQSQEMPHQVATRVCHADAKLPVAMCASCQVPFVFSAKMWASRSQCPWNEGFVKVPTIPPWIYLYINMLLSYWVFWPNFLSNKVVPKINMSSFPTYFMKKKFSKLLRSFRGYCCNAWRCQPSSKGLEGSLCHCGQKVYSI